MTCHGTSLRESTPSNCVKMGLYDVEGLRSSLSSQSLFSSSPLSSLNPTPSSAKLTCHGTSLRDYLNSKPSILNPINKKSPGRGDCCRCGPGCTGGGYLLSHFRSTIGVVRFNFSVRNGKRWNPHAIATLVSSPQVLLMAYKVKKSVETDRRAFTKP